jgi:hypothetical protein
MSRIVTIEAGFSTTRPGGELPCNTVITLDHVSLVRQVKSALSEESSSRNLKKTLVTRLDLMAIPGGHNLQLNVHSWDLKSPTIQAATSSALVGTPG